MKFYLVQSVFYDNGKTEAAYLWTEEHEKKPETKYSRFHNRDVYHDYFNSYEEAKQFVKETEEA